MITRYIIYKSLSLYHYCAPWYHCFHSAATAQTFESGLADFVAEREQQAHCHGATVLEHVGYG